MTQDRVGAGLAILAAIAGLVLVFSHRDVAGGEDDGPSGPAAPPSISQTVPAPGGQPGPVPPQLPQPRDVLDTALAATLAEPALTRRG